MEDIRTEVPKVKSMLDLTQSSFDKWMAEVKHTLIRNTQEQGHAAEDQMNDLKERAARLQALHKEVKALSSSMDNQLHEKEMVTQDMEQTRRMLEKEQDLLVDQDKTIDGKLKELNRAVELFRDRMSFTFKKSTGKRLQMVFTNISHKDPDLPFYFSCQVEDGKYIISDCEPAIPDLDALVEKLNSTNNMRSFVVAVRKRFKKMVENQ